MKYIRHIKDFLLSWFFSTNHKDIGTLYLVFGILAGIIGTPLLYAYTADVVYGSAFFMVAGVYGFHQIVLKLFMFVYFYRFIIKHLVLLWMAMPYLRPFLSIVLFLKRLGAHIINRKNLDSLLSVTVVGTLDEALRSGLITSEQVRYLDWNYIWGGELNYLRIPAVDQDFIGMAHAVGKNGHLYQLYDGHIFDHGSGYGIKNLMPTPDELDPILQSYLSTVTHVSDTAVAAANIASQVASDVGAAGATVVDTTVNTIPPVVVGALSALAAAAVRHSANSNGGANIPVAVPSTTPSVPQPNIPVGGGSSIPAGAPTGGGPNTPSFLDQISDMLPYIAGGALVVAVAAGIGYLVYSTYKKSRPESVEVKQDEVIKPDEVSERLTGDGSEVVTDAANNLVSDTISNSFMDQFIAWLPYIMGILITMNILYFVYTRYFRDKFQSFAAFVVVGTVEDAINRKLITEEQFNSGQLSWSYLGDGKLHYQNTDKIVEMTDAVGKDGHLYQEFCGFIFDHGLFEVGSAYLPDVAKMLKAMTNFIDIIGELSSVKYILRLFYNKN